MVNVILLTHEHIDHIRGAKVFLKSTTARVLCTNGTANQIETNCKIEHINTNMRINLNDELTVEVIKASHDAADAVGFIFHINDQKFVHLTDTGYILRENIEKCKNAYSYTIESNYEEQVLIVNDKYPFKVKQRILSELGHLSNEDCHAFLKENIGNNTKYVQFAHLSENNNSSELVEQLNTSLNIKNKTILAKDEIVVVNLCK